MCSKFLKISIFLFIILIFAVVFNSANAFDYYKKGYELEKQKKYFEAIAYYQNALKKNANYYDAYYHLGLCYFNLGRIEEADNVFSKAYFLNKDDINLLYNIALVKEKLKDYKKSLEFIDRIKKLKPTFLDAYYLEALIYLDEGFADHALQIYKEIYKKYPYDWKVNLNIFRFYKKMGNIEEGIEYLQNALNLNSHESSIYEELVSYYYSKSDYEKTEEYLDKLFSIEKNSFKGLLIAGSILFQKGDIKDSIVYFKKLYSMEPNNRDILWVLSNLYLLNNFYDNALNLSKKALEIYPQDEIIRYFVEEIVLKNREINNKIIKDLASFEFKWGNYFYTNGYEDYALNFLRRAVRLLPFKPDYRFYMSEVYKDKKMFFLQKEEYQILKNLDYPQIDIKLQIINHYLKNTLEEKYGYKPYEESKKSVIRIGLFSLNNKNNIIDYFEKKCLIDFLYSRMKYLKNVEIIKVDNDFNSLDKIAEFCKENDIEVIILTKPQTSYSSLEYFIDFDIINPENLMVLKKIELFSNSDFPLNEISYDLYNKVNEIFPLRGKILDLEGNIGIINLGWVNGINENTIIKIVSKKNLGLKFDKIELDFNDTDVVAICDILKQGESLTKVLIKKSNVYSKVQLGYYVVFEKKEKDNKKEANKK